MQCAFITSRNTRHHRIKHTGFVLQTIKQLQQRLAELKRTLQKELVRHRTSPCGLTVPHDSDIMSVKCPFMTMGESTTCFLELCKNKMKSCDVVEVFSTCAFSSAAALQWLRVQL